MKLVIAEKPSVAGEIAKIVGADKKEKGYYSGSGYIVSWCIGHLIQLAAPDAYNPDFKKWSLNTLPIIPEQYKTVVSEKTAFQYNVLKWLMNRADVTELVCATDSGREGELIFRLVYNEAECKKPFKRLWISSLEEKSISDGLASMKDGKEYDGLYMAALCRQRADWLLGINLTRLYSKLYNKTLRVGRVQTPTVNLIVKRQREISNFIPQIYYTLAAELSGFKAYCRVDNSNTAQDIINRCKGKEAFVTVVSRQEKKEAPPALYDLTALQRDANRLFEYTAKQTLDFMQNLYDAKLASYPRTDSRYITSDMEASTRSLIDTLISCSACGIISIHGYAPADVSLKRIVNDKKVTDHHAILPTAKVTRETFSALPECERNILTLIICRLFSATYNAHSYMATKVIFDIEGEAFSVTGKEVIEKGYKLFEEQLHSIIKPKAEKEDALDEPDNVVLPRISEGDAFIVKGISAEEKKTRPSKPYTEDTLLAAMEAAGKNISDDSLKESMRGKGLGTPATRAGIIENIIETGYVVRKNNKLLPTDTACTFIDIVTEKLKEPELTAEWERQLTSIQSGGLSDTVFMDGITGFIRSHVSDSKMLVSEFPESCTGMFESDKESMGACPSCGKKVVEYPKAFSCEGGKNECGFVIWKQIAQKTVSAAQVKQLLDKGKTGLVKGFKGKSGNTFDAFLVLKDDKTVGFEFPASVTTK